MRLQFEIFKSKAAVPPSQIQLFSWETRSIKLIYLLELIDFRPQSFAALGQSLRSPTFWWCFPVGMQCGNFWDCIRWIPCLRGSCGYSRPSMLIWGENWNWEGKENTRNPCHLSFGLFRLLCNSSLLLTSTWYQLLPSSTTKKLSGFCVES